MAARSRRRHARLTDLPVERHSSALMSTATVRTGRSAGCRPIDTAAPPPRSTNVPPLAARPGRHGRSARSAARAACRPLSPSAAEARTIVGGSSPNRRWTPAVLEYRSRAHDRDAGSRPRRAAANVERIARSSQIAERAHRVRDQLAPCQQLPRMRGQTLPAHSPAGRSGPPKSPIRKPTLTVSRANRWSSDALLRASSGSSSKPSRPAPAPRHRLHEAAAQWCSPSS